MPRWEQRMSVAPLDATIVVVGGVIVVSRRLLQLLVDHVVFCDAQVG
jgi:hypothetical protein